MEDTHITLSSVQLEGVTPARQARSEATFRALIVAGRKALDRKNFDDVTIEQIAHMAGASVGAFYGRFANKEAFFFAMQEITVAEIERELTTLLARPGIARADDRAFMRVLARFWVSIFRKNRGVYLAAFKHTPSHPSSWTPFKRAGWNIAGQVIEKLLPRLKARGTPSSEKEVRAAFQVVNGLLVNAVVNDPGPISLDDAEMQSMVTRFLCTYFGIEIPNGKGAHATLTARKR